MCSVLLQPWFRPKSIHMAALLYHVHLLHWFLKIVLWCQGCDLLTHICQGFSIAVQVQFVLLSFRFQQNDCYTCYRRYGSCAKIRYGNGPPAGMGKIDVTATIAKQNKIILFIILGVCCYCCISAKGYVTVVKSIGMILSVWIQVRGWCTENC